MSAERYTEVRFEPQELDDMINACEVACSNAKAVFICERGIQDAYLNSDIKDNFQYTSAPTGTGFIAPLLSPPIKNGLTDCFIRLLRLVHTIQDMPNGKPTRKVLREVSIICRNCQ